MKIQSSSIAMESTHSYSSCSYLETKTVEARASKGLTAAILELSEKNDDESYINSMKKLEEEEKNSRQKQMKENLKNMFQNSINGENKTQPLWDLGDDFDAKISLLRKILAALNGGLKGNCRRLDNGILDLRSPSFNSADNNNQRVSEALGNGVVTRTSGGTLWQKVTAVSGFKMEAESTTFASQGLVKTSDGTEISFNVELSMSRAYCEKVNYLKEESYILTDPLVINLDRNTTSISDQKFYFDLDSDGKTEQISFAGQGSGFLALDKNGDGIINDGSELFGTKSGDGFRDLSLYDQDGNGWIDENDDVFNDLKVWTKDEKGNDILLNLKEADVGAIYLGNADTEFSIKDEFNNTEAVIRKTGIYLKESTKAVGTLNHVDLAL